MTKKDEGVFGEYENSFLTPIVLLQRFKGYEQLSLWFFYVIIFFYYSSTARNASSRSSMISAIFSVPMERRMVLGLMP